MTEVIRRNLQSFTTWWILDLKNGRRSPEEVAEYATLTTLLLGDCKLDDENSLRRLAAQLAAQKLLEAK